MNRLSAAFSALFLLVATLLPSVAHAANTVVSVGFESGFIGEYSNGAHQPVSIKTFPTLGIDSVTISQTTDNGQFGGSQGNDYAVTVRIQFSNGTTKEFPAAVNWRDTQGSTIHGIGLTVGAGVVDGTTYTARTGYAKTYLFQFVGSTRVYSDTATGVPSGVVSGNAATNGLLSALNAYRTSAPVSTVPSGLTSVISAASPSITANGTSTTTITVQLKDVNGNNLTTGGNTVTLSTSAGTLSSVNDNGNGTYTATLRSSTSVTTATVTGTVDGIAITDDAQVQFVSTSSIAGTLTRANGSAVSGRNVQLVSASNQVVATATTAGNGGYSFTAVAPGTYSVQFESSGSYKAKAKSSTGSNQTSKVTGITVGATSTVTNVDAIVIDPAGVVYNSTTRAPVANAVVSLYYNNAKVSASWLDTTLGGANDQTTGADGAYNFVLNGAASSGTYELRVVAPTGLNDTASTAIAPSGTYTPSLGGGLESIQSQSTAPTGAQPTTYYLLFNFTIGANTASTSNGVINNHIPLDPVIAAPVFTNTNATDGSNNPSYAFTYDENRAAGATLGTVSATGTGTLTYSITAGNGASWFAIDSTTGVITMTQAGTTSLANDYETLANSQTLTVQVSDGTRTTTIEVVLNERNLDDTPPVITGPGGVAGATTAALSVNENQTGVTTLTADETVSWSLVGGEDQAKFAIDPTTGVLTFVAAPDYEAPTDGTTSGSNTYIVQVKATDAAGNISLQTITVTVLDVNETTAPVFTNTNATDGSNNPSYAFTYDENRAAGATLGTVSATGTGTLTYSITAGNGASWFAIDSTTGVITMTQAGTTSLANDYETLANSQTLTVQVSDGTRTTTIEIVLNERNLDDVALTSISGALTRANRSTGGGTGIGIGGRTVTLVDANNNVVATTTTAANGSYRFDNVVPGTYSVQFTNAVASSSAGTSSGSTVSNISVAAGATVTHVDAVLVDPSGVVYDSVRRTPIRNAQVSLWFGGAKVSNSWLDLTAGGANDQVTGADGRYSFILAGTASSGTYEIRVTGPSGYTNTESTLIPSSGTVTPALGGGLDNVQSQVTAPTGTQSTTYYLRFTFTIGVDAASTSNGIGNNHIPLDPVASPLAFTGTNATDAGNRPSYAFNYDEGRSQGATLGSVAASGGYSATRTFSIMGGNTSGWFAIDPATGAITLTSAGAASAANDFETDPNVHTLTVQVSDGFGTASIEVKLTEVNIDDSAPLITGPSGGAGAAESAVTIDEGLTLATTLTANETVSWSLVGGADQAQFVIDPATGALSFVAAPNFESPTDADRNNSYVVQVRVIDTSGNVALQTVTVTIRNVDEISRKLAQIADPLRNGLRNYAARSLSDMLSFNEQLLQDRNGDQCNVNGKKPVSGGFNANNLAQSARLNYAKVSEDCARHIRVFVNGAMAASRVHGDWTLRTLAALRVETDINPTLTLGAGVLGTFADDKLKAFADSSISDTSLQLNLYGRQRLTEKLRVAAFAGYGRAWYDFGLTDNGFVMTGKMTGDRFTYGATLTGDIDIGSTALTTDLIVSHAQERLGTARLAASYLGEQRSGIGFLVGNVDVTRLSVPVHLPIDFQKSAYEGGNAARLELSPGLLCEDNSADSSALSCGFRADAKLLVTRGVRTQAYLDATFETVGGMQRYLGGFGFGYRFGPRDALEIGTTFDAGTTGLRQEARAMIQLKLVK